MNELETSANSQNGNRSGFMGWLRGLFGGKSAGPGKALAQVKAKPIVDMLDEDKGEFVVAPCGYRIRVPQREDVNHSVGEMLPTVKEGLQLFPPLPQVVMELLREIQDSKSTAASVATVASSDPALAASLIRTVNGAAMGLSRKISSVSEAVSYLGFGVVKSIVIRLRLEDVLSPKNEKSAADVEDLWIHSLAVSYVAEKLAQRVSGVDSGFVATLGLLHDIGKLAVAAQLSTRAAKQSSTAIDPSESPLAREARMYGVDHAGLGADLAVRWKLPADLVQAIRCHHRPADAFHATDPLPLRKAMHIVQIANQLVKYCYPHADTVVIDSIPDSVFELLGLEPSLLKLLDDKIKAAVGRAILFAQANSKRPLSAPRRFLRLLSSEEATAAAAGNFQSLISQDPATVDSMFADDAPTTRFVEPATPAGIERCIKAVFDDQNEMDLTAESRGQATMVVKSLLPNVQQLCAPEEQIEVAHQAVGRRYVLAVRARGLAFQRRLGDAGTPQQGLQLAQGDFAHLLNLGWFPKITLNADGSALMLADRESQSQGETSLAA